MIAKLLIVDDDPDLVPLVTDLLRDGPGTQWIVDWAPTSAEGERLLVSNAYDAAVVDYYLGEITGVELVRRVRAREIRTPLVILTGHGDRSVDVAAMEAGADDFLQKDLLSEGLLERSLRYAIRHAADRRRIEEREQHFRALIQQASDAILLLDASGRVIFASDSVMRVTGFAAATLIGRNTFERLHPDDVDDLRAVFDECLINPGRHVTASYRAQHADGSWRYREASAVNRLNEAAVQAIVVNFRDVTDRYETEAQRAHLAAIVQSSEDAILSQALTGEILSWNVAAERLYGYSPAEAVGRSAVALMVHPDDQKEFRRTLQRVEAGDAGTIQESRALRKDGSALTVSVTMSPIRGPGGVITGVASVARDISPAVEARRALLTREREFRSLFQNSPVGLVRASVEGRWEDVNAQACTILEYPADELIGANFTQFVHPDDLGESVAAFEALRSGRRASFDAEKRYRTKHGKDVWVRSRVNPFHDERGQLSYFIVAFADVTGRRAMEEQLRSTVARLEALIAHLPLSIWVLDRAGVVTFSEGHFVSQLGASGEDPIGRSHLELFKDHPELLALSYRALAGEQVHATPQVANRHFETWYQPLRSPAGELAGAVGIAIDITERLKLEAQYRQAQKMEAIGMLAGGVAHDFNNLLTAIIGYAEMALEQAAADTELYYQLDQVLQAAQSGGSLTRQLLAFSRRQMLQPKVVDLNATVKATHGLLARLIGEDITLATELRSTRHVFADPGQVQQIILNLAVNARDAMPKGGTLSLRTADVNISQEFVETHAGASVGPHVRLEVADTGVGMPAPVRARIFEPFFTTKERGRGTGLGLATVYGIVKQSGGSIWVESTPGHGTTFSVLLPVATETPEPPQPVQQPKPVEGRHQILVVEDQPEVRAMARLILQRQGYEVYEASTPSAAIALVRNGVAKPNLLFSDVVMPEMSGRELAEQLQRMLPEMRVLFTSGYTDDAIVHHGVLGAGLSFLPKPYTGRDLLLRIEELIR
jgi:two-component system, cell cycle sensor histidine kinase and response regulator CckA